MLTRCSVVLGALVHRPPTAREIRRWFQGRKDDRSVHAGRDRLTAP